MIGMLHEGQVEALDPMAVIHEMALQPFHDETRPAIDEGHEG